MMNVLEKYLNPIYRDDIIPLDNSTLFVCSGMQQYKEKFRNVDYSRISTIQSCIRTNDLDLVGDGTHLTSFQMVGNFSFGNNDYSRSVDLWKQILSDLNIKDYVVHIHPESNLKQYWENTVDDLECVWSDGGIGGYCSEIYIGDLEIGNLVNPLGHSTDVGFGLERILQVMEGKTRVDETSLFDQTLPPVVRDHYRTLLLMKKNGVKPGSGKGRPSICRRLMKKVLSHDLVGLEDWLESERIIRNKKMIIGKQQWDKPKNKIKPLSWWWEVFGITEEDLEEVKRLDNME